MSSKSGTILIPTAPGELIDKITVLQIKKERITDKDRLANVARELEMLEDVRKSIFPNDSEFVEKLNELELALKKSNEEIWDMGDKIRELGDAKDFNQEFIDVAYGIHLSNDTRASIKKQINLLLGSAIIEEKSYKHWK